VLSTEEGELHCTWGDETLCFTGSGTNARTPQSLAALFRVCGALEFGEVGATGQLVLHDGFSGTLHALGRDIWSHTAPENLCSPIDIDLGAFYVFDPRNAALWFVDEGPMEPADTGDAVGLYWRELTKRLA